MALNLASSKHMLTYDMISCWELSMSQMAQATSCSRSTILTFSSNMGMVLSVKAPSSRGGRPRSIALIMLVASCEHLVEKPTLYLDKIAIFLWDESSISRALRFKG